jgi:hypothetical protein
MLYLLLAAIGASILASWLWRPPGPVPVALFGLTLASVGTANLVLYGVLRLYSYRTGLAPPPRDDYLGEFLAEFIFVPALFSLVARVHGRWRYAAGLAAAGLLAGLQVLFARIGIFRENGFPAWLTLVLFGLYSLAAAWWSFRFSAAGYTVWHRLLILPTMADAAWHYWALTLQRLLGRGKYAVHLLAAEQPNQVLAGTLLHGLPFLLIGVPALWFGWCRRAPGAVAAGACFGAWIWLTQRFGWYSGTNALWGGATAGFLLYGLGWLDSWFAKQK